MSGTGTFIDLAQGRTHYRLAQREGTDLVVFLHGFSVGSFVWKPLEARLAEAGHSTLAYDMYGHGFSDKPRLRYTRDLFAQQLSELLAAIAPGARVHLVGWSMGAMVATSFALAQKNTVGSLFMVSPSGLPIRMGVLGRTALVPVIGDLGFALIGAASLRAAQANFFIAGRAPSAYLRAYDEQAAQPGFARAMLSALRCMKMDAFHADYMCLGDSALPVEVVWACQDEATPFANSATFAQLVPQAEITPLEGVGHASQFEAPDLVAASLLPWLARHCAR